MFDAQWCGSGKTLDFESKASSRTVAHVLYHPAKIRVSGVCITMQALLSITTLQEPTQA